MRLRKSRVRRLSLQNDKTLSVRDAQPETHVSRLEGERNSSAVPLLVVEKSTKTAGKYIQDPWQREQFLEVLAKGFGTKF
jgi:hypothetical protein